MLLGAGRELGGLGLSWVRGWKGLGGSPLAGTAQCPWSRGLHAPARLSLLSLDSGLRVLPVGSPKGTEAWGGVGSPEGGLLVLRPLRSLLPRVHCDLLLAIECVTKIVMTASLGVSPLPALIKHTGLLRRPKWQGTEGGL